MHQTIDFDAILPDQSTLRVLGISARYIFRRDGRTVIINISGPSGSGKGKLAQFFMRKLIPLGARFETSAGQTAGVRLMHIAQSDGRRIEIHEIVARGDGR